MGRSCQGQTGKGTRLHVVGEAKHVVLPLREAVGGDVFQVVEEFTPGAVLVEQQPDHVAFGVAGQQPFTGRCSGDDVPDSVDHEPREQGVCREHPVQGGTELPMLVVAAARAPLVASLLLSR